MQFRVRGVIAAAVTPMDEQGKLRLGKIREVVDRLIEDGVNGFYVCGSTGEGVSLTSAERRQVAEAFVDAVAGRGPVLVQVGHNSLAEARELAAHAQQIGATAVSATCPSYFKINSVDVLVDCMAEVAAGAPELPFYYYHIPSLTGVPLSMAAFLERGSQRIPNLVGMKYTATTLPEFQACIELQHRRYDILWGTDEMMLAALATGATGFVGSTYNLAMPLYRRVIEAFEAKDIPTARAWQSRAVGMVRVLEQWPMLPALKAVLAMLGVDVGPCRLPHPRLAAPDRERLRSQLQSIGFFQWRNGNG
ncbi:MAG: N-acetylneuraminate lyase [Planctomycetes bacterium]|nr:N-acetylneuraminate lyase [Planctomycetota bacterium]